MNEDAYTNGAAQAGATREGDAGDDAGGRWGHDKFEEEYGDPVQTKSSKKRTR